MGLNKLIDINLQKIYDNLIKQYVDKKVTDHADTAATNTITGHVKVDASLSTTSTNPLQNKIIKAELDKKANTSHIHDPAGSSLGMVKSGGDVTISSGVITVNDDSHNHIIGNIDGLQSILDGLQTSIDDKAALMHTHNYAGSSSAGGAANSAATVYGTLTNPTSGTTYFIPFHTSASSANKSLLTNDGIRYWTKEGTTDTVGIAELGLGNNIVSGATGNKKGMLYLYGSSSGYTEISCGNNTTNNISITLPSSSGTLALVSGNVATATALTSSAGSATQPVYFKDGKPVAITYTIAKSVPANAVFTDTVYTHPTTSGNKHIPAGGSSGQILVWSADGTAVWGVNTNTWRGIQNNLTSDSTTDSLSAAQGKVLKGLVDGKLSLSGGTMTGTISSSKVTNTYLAGNQGATIINSTAGAGNYIMLAKMNSTNGYFTHGTYQTKYLLQYTAKTTVEAGTNNVTKSATLLDEGGNTTFPGTVTASIFSGSGASLSSLNASNIASGTLNSSRLPTVPVSKGGTGLTTLTSGQVLVGNGTGNVILRAIDTTTGGTSGSTSLITSGAVYAGLSTKASSSHTHNYAGSNSAGGHALNANALYLNPSSRQTSANLDMTNASYSHRITYMLATSSMTTDKPPSDAHILTFGWDSSAGYGAQIAISDSFSNHLYIRGAKSENSKCVWESNWRTVLDSSNYTSFSPTKTGSGASGTWGISISGNAATATKLATARTINGTSFNGSANITTANWGTARTITIGSTGKSINGSGNVSWTLAEIGAAAASHSHSYLPLSGGTMTGNISFNLYSSTQIPFKVYGGDVNGQGISIGAGAATIVGGGESAKACESLLGATTEELWLTSDGNIRFYTNCQTIGNKVGVILNTTRAFYPDTNNTGSLGTSSYKWANVYATTFNGALSGNASTATALTTSAGSATKPIYFSGGKPVACTYELLKTVPSDAIFTDTKNTAGATNTSSKIYLIGATSQDPNLKTYSHDTVYVGTNGCLYSNGEKVSTTGHTHSYLPISGGTLTGRMTANDKITIPTSGVSWIGGMTGTYAAIQISTQQTSSSYFPVLYVKTSGNHVVNLGGLGDNFGFYGYKSGRTTNGYDWATYWDVSTGHCYTTGNIRANGEIQSTSINAFRSVYGNYGIIFRNDGNNFYMLATNSGDAYGTYSIFRPFYYNMGTSMIYVQDIEITGNNFVFKDWSGSMRKPVASITGDGKRVAFISAVASNGFNMHAQWNSSNYSSLRFTSSSSDIRLKENIRNTSITDALSTINKIILREFDWKRDKQHQKIGFIADELELIDSNLASGGGYDEDGAMMVKCVDTFYLMGYVVKGIQELCTINTLKDIKFTDITSHLDTHEAQIKSLQCQLSEAKIQIAQQEVEITRLKEMLQAS